MAYKKKTNAPRPKKVIKRRAPAKSFEKRVKAIISKQVETKHAFTTLGITAFNSGISVSADCIQIVPNLSNGTADNQRIGDQVRFQRLQIKGHMLNQPTSSSSGVSGTQPSNISRIAVRMMVVSPKTFPQFQGASINAATWLASLLKKGGTTTAFTGTISDLYAPINTDYITKYYDKVVYLPIPSVNYLTAPGGSGAPVDNTISYDVSTSCKFFNINLKLRNKLVKYDTDTNSSSPTNYGPIFLLGYVKLDGSTPDVVSAQVLCAYDAMLSYEDA